MNTICEIIFFILHRICAQLGKKFANQNSCHLRATYITHEMHFKPLIGLSYFKTLGTL